MATLNPIERSCATCGNDFLVPAAEREFRRERGLLDPEECASCRARSRSTRNADLLALYERAGSLQLVETISTSRRGGPSRQRQTAPAPDAPKQRFSTVCDACGAETTVPFVPRGDRPIYCRDCFNARKGR